MDAAFGGDVDIAAGSDSYGRFARMASLMDGYEPERHGPVVEYALTILDEVRARDTLRTVVYDSRRLRVSWRTPGNRAVRWLELPALALDAGSVVSMLDVESGGPGDASALLEPMTPEANRLIVEGTKGAWANRLIVEGTQGDRPGRPETAAGLGSRGRNLETALGAIAGHPTRTGGQR